MPSLRFTSGKRNDVIKRHSNDITIWRTSAIEMTALFISLRLEIKDVQKIQSIMGVRGR